MKLVLLGSLPRWSWLASRVLADPRFLGNLLADEGIAVSDMIASPKPLRPVIREWRARYHWGSIRHAMRKVVASYRHSPQLRDEGNSGSRQQRAMDLPVHRVPSLRSPMAVERMQQLSPDLAIYTGGREIIPKAILDVPRIGVLGGHWGRLPEYRGMNVTEWALFHEDQPWASVQIMDAGVDVGAVVLQRPVPLRSGDDIASIRYRSSRLADELLVEAALQAQQATLDAEPQDLSQGRQFFTMDERLRRVLEWRLKYGDLVDRICSSTS